MPAPGRPGRRRAAAIGLLLSAAAAIAAVGVGAPSAGADAVPLQLIVTTSGRVRSAAALTRSSGLDVRSVRPIGARTAVVGVLGTGARSRLLRTEGVVSVDVDRRMRIAGASAPVHSGARLESQQWSLWDARSTRRAGGYGIDAARAWTRTTGASGVVVAVLDTGITAHPALAGASVAPGYDFVSGIDGTASGDGDGWDADPEDPGDACSDTGEASSWHGTFVTGEIVGRHGGSIAGAAPGVTILPVRVLGLCGGAESDTVAAITWASGGEVPGVPAPARRADVLSMSLGSAEGGCPPALQAAIDGAVARGTTVVAAAGNDGGDVADSSPANCAGVVSVAATTRGGALAGYSNRGLSGTPPVLAAPGGSRSDPVLGAGWSAGGRPTVVGEAGTSMAAPHVAAAAALLLSVQPGLAPARVAARLVATATRFPASSDCTAEVCGPGVVNAGNAVGAAKRFVRVSPPAVSGTARPGRTLTAGAGTWRPAPVAVRWRWLRDGRPIQGATARTYTVRTRDLRHRLAVRVTVVRAGAVASVATSGSRTIGAQ